MPRRLCSHLLTLALGLTVVSACRRSPDREPVPELGQLIESLSEPGGYFDSDNLISNETSYAQVVDDLQPSGGVYIGVGPEQNFTYIGRLRPRWAFIVDIRRQNMLQHLLYNAILWQARTPFEYLCWLFSRPVTPDDEPPTTASIEEVVVALESLAPSQSVFESNLQAVFEHIETRLRFRLGTRDRRRVRAIYSAFLKGQLGIRFRTHGRPPMPYHPDFRSLLMARDPAGGEGNFLASPEDYGYVRRLAMEGRLVPVVGDFAGSRALRAVGEFVRERGETVSAFYVSNVEFYLLRAGGFHQYVENVRSLPLRDDSLFIRAYFDYGLAHPAGMPGHRSTTILQQIPRFLALYDSGAYHSYWEVSTMDYLH
jgi:hypothetical protein